MVLDSAGNRFQVLSRDDDGPLGWFVLRGISAWATRARWQVSVDRQDLREGFEDPVATVELELAVGEGCAGVPPSDGALRLRGHLIEGDPLGVSTWGGDFDAADLPCGRLDWTLRAATGLLEISERVEWDLWPSDQLFPLSLLTLLGGESSWVPDFLREDSALKFAPWNLEIKAGVLKVKRRGAFLDYTIGTLAFGTDVKAPTQNSFISLLGKTVFGLQGISAEISGMKMDGETGMFEFTGKGGVTLGTSKHDMESGFLKKDIRLKTRIGLQPELKGSLAFTYAIEANRLFSLDTPVPPPSRTVAPGGSGETEWREAVGAAVTLGVETEPPLVVIPPPVQWVLSELHLLAVRLGGSGTWTAKLS